MNNTVMRITMGGGIRAIVGDGLSSKQLAGHGCDAPTRASRIEPIDAGPQAGLWMVDMSPMGDDWRYCLWPPQETRAAALKTEHQHLDEEWIQK